MKYVVLTAKHHSGHCLWDTATSDYDVATSAEPAEVSALFTRTLEVGAQFGVIIVMMGKHQIEVARETGCDAVAHGATGT